VLSGRGLCDELITCPEESYRLWCVVVCDLENFKNKEAMTRVGSQRHKKIYIITYYNTTGWLASNKGQTLVQTSNAKFSLYPFNSFQK
jgi:hypothetical protein